MCVDQLKQPDYATGYCKFVYSGTMAVTHNLQKGVNSSSIFKIWLVLLSYSNQQVLLKSWTAASRNRKTSAARLHSRKQNISVSTEPLFLFHLNGRVGRSGAQCGTRHISNRENAVAINKSTSSKQTGINLYLYLPDFFLSRHNGRNLFQVELFIVVIVHISLVHKSWSWYYWTREPIIRN
jgi:hypothetical protein